MDCQHEELEIGLALAKLRAVTDLVGACRDLHTVDPDALGLLLNDIYQHCRCALNRNRPAAANPPTDRGRCA